MQLWEKYSFKPLTVILIFCLNLVIVSNIDYQVKAIYVPEGMKRAQCTKQQTCDTDDGCRNRQQGGIDNSNGCRFGCPQGQGCCHYCDDNSNP